MRPGVRRQVGLGALWLLGVAGSGCAALGLGKGASEASQAPSQTPAGPTCPVSLMLGTEPGASQEPGPWLRGLSVADLEPAPEYARESFRHRLELASGPLEVVGLALSGPKEDSGGGARVVLARPESGGYCVPHHWVTWLSSSIGLSLAGSWTSADGRLGLLLLKLEAPTAEGPEARWVVIGTDGASAWFALGSPEQHQLIVPSVAFFTRGKQLYLDIKQRYVTRLALGKDGRFIQPTPR